MLGYESGQEAKNTQNLEQTDGQKQRITATERKAMHKASWGEQGAGVWKN